MFWVEVEKGKKKPSLHSCDRVLSPHKVGPQVVLASVDVPVAYFACSLYRHFSLTFLSISPSFTGPLKFQQLSKGPFGDCARISRHELVYFILLHLVRVFEDWHLANSFELSYLSALCYGCIVCIPVCVCVTSVANVCVAMTKLKPLVL